MSVTIRMASEPRGRILRLAVLSLAFVAIVANAVVAIVTVTQLQQNYGARYAIRFNPMGWATQAGKTYAVAVSGIPTPINYTVQVVDCP